MARAQAISSRKGASRPSGRASGANQATSSDSSLTRETASSGATATYRTSRWCEGRSGPQRTSWRAQLGREVAHQAQPVDPGLLDRLAQRCLVHAVVLRLAVAAELHPDLVLAMQVEQHPVA